MSDIESKQQHLDLIYSTYDKSYLTAIQRLLLWNLIDMVSLVKIICKYPDLTYVAMSKQNNALCCGVIVGNLAKECCHIVLIKVRETCTQNKIKTKLISLLASKLKNLHVPQLKVKV
eukprot:31263_1